MSTFKDLDRLLQGFTDSGLPGCTLHVTQRGKLIYEGCFGWSDIENRVPVTEWSVFRMASMSKLPLYTVMMMLYEKGKCLLTDPIWLYLPEWKDMKKCVRRPNGSLEIVPAERPITISDAMSMKCGLPYCNSKAPTDDPTLRSMQACMEPLWAKGRYTVQEHIAAMSKAVLAFEPGTHWLYGFSSEITAALIEKLADKPIDDVFREYLFEPLGMTSTASRFFGDMSNRLVKLYTREADGTLAPTRTDFDRKFLPGPEHDAGWGRLFSNVNDYTRLLGMLANGGVWDGVRIMGRKTIDLMRANSLNDAQMRDFENLYNAGYGYGLGVRTRITAEPVGGRGQLGEFGWDGAACSYAVIDPVNHLSAFFAMHVRSFGYAYDVIHPTIRDLLYKGM